MAMYKQTHDFTALYTMQPCIQQIRRNLAFNRLEATDCTN